MHPVIKRLIISLPIAFTAAIAAYFLLPLMGLDQANPTALFALGIGLGICVGALTVPVSTATTTRSPASIASQQTTKVMQQAVASASSENPDNDERKTVFVGNLAYRASPRQLRELFEAYGTVHSVRIATDRNTRKPRGFGFVEMNQPGAILAIEALHGSQLCDRELNLSEAKQRANN